MAVVVLPGILQPAAGGHRRVTVDGASVAEVLQALCVQLPALRVHLYTDAGLPRPHVRCVLGDLPVRLDDDTAVGTDDEVLILPAVSGG